MNKYRVGLFYETGGVFQDGVGGDLDTWLEVGVGDGYHLVGPCLPMANDSGLYVVATMELDDDHETPSGFYEPIG